MLCNTIIQGIIIHDILFRTEDDYSNTEWVFVDRYRHLLVLCPSPAPYSTSGVIHMVDLGPKSGFNNLWKYLNSL